MEYLLHYVWKHLLDRTRPMATTDGRAVRVIDPGLRNGDAGPDFFNAKVEIGGTMWAGCVEVHDRSSDWYAHGHDRDRAYDSVVLHVCKVADRPVVRHDGGEVPQLVLEVPPHVRRNYEALRSAEMSPACSAVIDSIAPLVRHSWLSALAVERLRGKTGLVAERLARFGGNWEDVFFVSLARNFGFGVNGDSFERWAAMLPFRAMDKHRDSLRQVESLMFGISGLLREGSGDAYEEDLLREYAYLKHKFSLPEPPDFSWKLLRMRPGNFPHVRIAQLARIYQSSPSLFSRVLDCGSVDELRRLFKCGTSDYWHTHYTFGHESPGRRRMLSDRSADLVVINTVVPFLYAYGSYTGDGASCDKALALLESVGAEDNHVVRNWVRVGIVPDNAADSQALIELTREYCQKRKCFFCRFGYEYLKCERIL